MGNSKTKVDIEYEAAMREADRLLAEVEQRLGIHRPAPAQAAKPKPKPPAKDSRPIEEQEFEAAMREADALLAECHELFERAKATRVLARTDAATA